MSNGELNFYDVSERFVNGAIDVEEIAKSGGNFTVITDHGVPYYVITRENKKDVLTQVYNGNGQKVHVLMVTGVQEEKILGRFAGRGN